MRKRTRKDPFFFFDGDESIFDYFTRHYRAVDDDSSLLV